MQSATLRDALAFALARFAFSIRAARSHASFHLVMQTENYDVSAECVTAFQCASNADQGKATCAAHLVSATQSYGRGAGVGRGRGVGVALGVGVAVGVGVTVAVGVAVAVAVGVGVGVGVGLGAATQYLPPVLK
jgi:hypothetical protein